MSAGTSIDMMKAENDFCSICLRTQAEAKLYAISTKIYEMFFVELVKCVESKKASRSICVWCRRRVSNALKLVETARTSDRILANITQIDKSHCQSFKQTIWDHIQATKITHVLIPRTSQIISCNLPPDTGIGVSVKEECDNCISGQERNVYFDSVIKSELDPFQSTKGPHVSTQRTSCDFISGTLPSDTGINFSVKLENEDDISGEEENFGPNGVINDGELDDKGLIDLKRHDFLASSQGSEIDDKLTSEFDVEEKTPCLNEVRKQGKPMSSAVTEKITQELNKTVYIEVSRLEPVDTHENRSSSSEVVSENLGSKFEEQASNIGSQNLESRVEVGDSETNSRTAYSSADALKHISLVQLTETQRLQELEGRRRELRYRNAPFKCEPCALHFTFRNTYEAHMERHSESYGSHKCSVCGTYVKKLNLYRKHYKKHYERHECTKCGFNSSRRQRVLEHYLFQHNNQRHKCENWVSEFSQHKCVKNGERPRTRHCKICSRTFCTEYYLRQHLEMHTREKTFFCQRCGDGFRSPWGLQSHTKRRHPDVCFECDYCHKTFGVKSDLKQHITWMHLKRGYNCKFCSKMFRSKAQLRQHVKQQHEGWTGPKDKICEECGKGFSLNSTLRNHRRIHSLERPFSCTICTDAFKHPSTRKKHMRLVHKIKN